MLTTFDSSFGIAVCANEDSLRAKWVNIFVKAMGGATVTPRRGVWPNSTGGVDDEPSILVEHAGPDEPQFKRLLILARAFQLACSQQAVWLEFYVNGQWRAYVVETEADWAELVTDFCIPDFFVRAATEANNSQYLE